MIVASGEIDRSTAPALSDRLRIATFEGKGAVTVDLCEVSFMDSSGISVLLNALRRLTRQRRAFRLVCAPGNVRRVFELTGLVGTFAIYASIEEAVAASP